MDERKKLLSYIGPARWLVLAGVLLLCAALVCAFYDPAVEIPAPQYPPPIPDEAPDFESSETVGELVYLDTIAVSDAICSGSEGQLYYAAEDDSHLFHIVCVSGETYALMGPQRALWNDPGSEASFIRLTGRRTVIPDEVKQAFLGVFSMDAEVFDGYFGRVCLVEEPQNIQTPVRSPAWTVLAVLFTLGFLAVLGLWLSSFLPSWSALVRLEETERLEDAADEFDEPAARRLRDDRLRMTQGYLFLRHGGLAAAWEDVAWSYERRYSLGSSVLANALVIGTADGRRHRLWFPAQEIKELRKLANAFCERNPKMLWGFSQENLSAWRKLSS